MLSRSARARAVPVAKRARLQNCVCRPCSKVIAESVVGISSGLKVCQCSAGTVTRIGRRQGQQRTGAKMVSIANRIERPVGSASGRSVHLARKLAGASSAVVALVLFGTGGASAQNCNIEGFPGADVVSAATAGAVSAIAGSLGNIAAAFQAQQTSAFVAGATASGGGVWGRFVGGEVETKSTTTVNSPLVAPILIRPGGGACTSSVKQKFSGFQAGRDLSQFDLLGFNVHWGTTVGYLESRGDDINGNDITPGAIHSEFKVPFIGTYLVATQGNFFSDVMVRREYYNVAVNQPAFNLHNQEFGARAWSVSIGAGYNFALYDGWFIEPSAGFFWSRTEVDPVTLAGPVGQSDQRHPGGQRHRQQGRARHAPLRTELHERRLGPAAIRLGQRVPRVRRGRHRELPQLHWLRGGRNRAGNPGGADRDHAGRHIRSVFARPRRAGHRHWLGRLCARRLPQGRQYRGLDRQRRPALQLYAGAGSGPQDGRQGTADPDHRAVHLVRPLRRRTLRRGAGRGTCRLPRHRRHGRPLYQRLSRWRPDRLQLPERPVGVRRRSGIQQGQYQRHQGLRHGSGLRSRRRLYSQ